MRSRYFTPSIHFIVWATLLVVPFILFHFVPVDTKFPDNFFIITNIYHIGLFYLNAYYLYPKLLNKKYWWLYILIIAAILAFSFYIKVYFIKLAQPSFSVERFNLRVIFFPPIPFLIAGTIFRFVQNRIQFEKREKQQKAERLSAELKFLRSQVSPHFLFNMMANMVSLARQKSDLLETYLLKLSDLLRYMLYESDEKFSISKEIDYLKNYIELQELRFGESVDVQLDIDDHMPDCYIEPMLLVPFVENAFKHGIGLVEDPFIIISLQAKDKQLHFTVVNNYSRKKISKDKNSGIGLENVKNRLQLLYPGKYGLKIDDEHDIFSVELNLELLC